MSEESVFTNLYFNNRGYIKHLGWNNFEEFIRVITKANNYALKTGCKSEIRFMLPIKKKLTRHRKYNTKLLNIIREIARQGEMQCHESDFKYAKRITSLMRGRVL